MSPGGQGFDPAKPSADVLILLTDIEAQFLRRIVEVTDQGKVGDGGLIAEYIEAISEVLIEDAKRTVDARF